MIPFSDLFDRAQQAVFEGLLQPVMVALGMQNLLAEGFNAAGWLLVGLGQLLVIVTVLRGLERWRPAEAVTDRAAVRTDIVYTLIHRLGLVRVLLFLGLGPVWDGLLGELRLLGFAPPALDQLWPGVTDGAVVSFLLYLVLFDFVDYWYHRASHLFNWWWALHAVHHSQRQMTMWSDQRNHLLDDLVIATVFALLARVIGVEPGQFVAITVITQLHESLQHANARIGFGRVGERLLVSPRFHRLHHAIGLGHESAAGRGTLGGCNFAVLFPVWDILFGTADFRSPVGPTGIRDQLPEEGGRDYGRGFWAQQRLGLLRLIGRG